MSEATTNSAGSRAWIVRDAGPPAVVQIRFRLTPKSSRDAVDGITETPDGAAIKSRVRAVPENGAANRALIATVAKWLALPKSSIELTSGSKSRTKLLTIAVPATELQRVIAQLDGLANG